MDNGTCQCGGHSGGGSQIVSALVLAAGIAGGLFMMSEAYEGSNAMPETITVTGVSEERVMSDHVRWGITVARSVKGSELQAATKKIAEDVTGVQEYLAEKKIPKEAISVKPLVLNCSGPYVIYDSYGRSQCPVYEALNAANDKVTGGGVTNISIENLEVGFGDTETTYSIQRTVVVESSEIDVLEPLIDLAPQDIAAAGIAFASQDVQYTYTKLDDLKQQLISNALKVAAERADALATASFSDLDGIQSLTMNQFQVVPATPSTTPTYYEYYPPATDVGTFDTTSKEKKVSASLTVSYLIDN